MATYNNYVPRNVKARTILKMGTANEWSQATNFKPMLGEPIIEYAINNEGKSYISKIKFGDGQTLVNDLIPYDKPYIKEETGNWFIGGEDSGVSAIPNVTINDEGYWIVNGITTTRKALFTVYKTYENISAM